MKRISRWADVTPKTFAALTKAVAQAVVKLIPQDFDGDRPVQVIVINRNEQEYFHYHPVPRIDDLPDIYDAKLVFHPDKESEMEDDAERVMLMNLHVAYDELDRHMSGKHRLRMKERESHLPLKEQVDRACNLCKKGVGFKQVNNPNLPGWPPTQHVGGEICGSHSIRRAQYDRDRRKDKPDPEPLYCSNPKCRARLYDYSDRHVKQNICPNPKCMKDNG